MTIGTELREARERLGLSREQISSATKIQLHKIAALEDDAFDRLPTGIYLDGIAAAYARELGLDADDVVRRLRAHVTPPPSRTLEEIVAVRQAREERARELQFTHVHGMLAFAAVAAVLAVLSVGLHLYPPQSVTVPAQTVAVAERAELRLPYVGTQYSDTTVPEPVGTAGVEPVDEPAESQRLKQPAESGALHPQPGAQKVVEQPAGPRPIEQPVEQQPIEQRAQPQATELPAAPPSIAHLAQAQSAAEPAAVPDAGPLQAADAALVELSPVAGAWTVETIVESSSLRAFEGLRLGYRLELRQEGGRIVGTGRKISENGIALSGGRQTPIAVEGTIAQGRLQLTFGEHGARRTSKGRFDLVLEDAGVLRGHFSSDAARSAGIVKARRL
jgi:cytoskeleton protein RodZ